ncbi:MAG: PadR family transcriptional regulator [Vicinamibacterales bacterium]
MFHRDLPAGSAELLVLALVEERERHGYEIAKLIGMRSRGELTYHVASLYPLLYRLERRGLLQGRWREQAGARRRRFYRLTPEGRKVVATQRRSWRAFFSVLSRVARIRHA